MAEERESQQHPQAAGPAALALLASASRDKADAYIEAQTALARVQAEELEDEVLWRHWSLRVRHTSDVLKLGFELSLAFVGVALAVGLAAMILAARHADGLIIERFNVPAALAAKGLSGDVIANKLLDRLTYLQSQTDSSRAASSYAHDWAKDIKVEIPETGISLGEVVRFLNGWLGHQTYLSGDVYETPSGFALTVRTDNMPGQTFEGGAGDVDKIVHQATEAIFAETQPYRYAVYLADKGDFAASYGQLLRLASSTDRIERAWADLGLAVIEDNRGTYAAAAVFIAKGRQEHATLPNLEAVTSNIAYRMSHDEAALALSRRGLAALDSDGARELNPAVVPSERRADQSSVDQALGDFRAALANNVLSPGGNGGEGVMQTATELAIAMNDGPAARQALALLEPMREGAVLPDQVAVDSAQLHGYLAIEQERWAEAIAAFRAGEEDVAKLKLATKGWWDYGDAYRRSALPDEALAYAKLGDFAKADAILNSLPGDCDYCARRHGAVEALRHNWSGAATWFKRVADRSPSIPFADNDWGRMLLAKGDLDGAIAKFAAAHAKGPHFADPLELWGEVLIAKNRSDLALAKFAEAAQYAPNWGRLHLKWGEALHWLGRNDEAQKQSVIAAKLDLTSAERAQLDGLKARHG